MLEVFLRGIGLSCQIYLRIRACAVIQAYHKSLECFEKILSGADARTRNALVTFKEVFHTAVSPSSRKCCCRIPTWDCITINSSSELIYYLEHVPGGPDSENHHIGVHGAEGVFCDIRFHSSSV